MMVKVFRKGNSQIAKKNVNKVIKEKTQIPQKKIKSELLPYDPAILLVGI